MPKDFTWGRTVGHLKVPLLLLRTAAFFGATLCGIIYLHGYAVRLFSGFVVKLKEISFYPCILSHL
jgi:hypothetical protein